MGTEWYVYWAASIALLRTVNDVLILSEKNDKSAPHKIKCIEDWIAKTKNTEDWSYKEKLKNVGDKLLHHYKLGVNERERINLPFVTDAGDIWVTDAGDRWVVPGASVPMTADGFLGQDAPKALQEACEWWDRQLSCIEACLATRDKA
ncbi:hypothetical protein [Siccirubricoccus sp. G192]|uniref:hypothetical protein n=1 Tax=Siccirubricoccus sp. G192 TaxID=2849651 RepID=UPI001C2C8BFD|nr:hypothetical protein [Siccirubricoccus sp. G192]MBV1796174.1 hypothetical protein [Siccirubricoccus sp. G192]